MRLVDSPQRAQRMHIEFQISNLKFEITNLSVPSLCLCGESNLPYPQASPTTHAAPLLTKIFFTILLFLLFSFIANAQDSSAAAKAGDALVVDGSYASDVFGLGRDVRVRGEVNGVIAFGGNVIVEGKVTGDAAAIGGSVIQREGSYVGGDVMVFGGSYRQEGAASRNPAEI